MAEDNGIPPWVQFLTEYIDKKFDSLEGRIDKLVTNDAFRDEKRRVDQEFRRQDQAIKDLGEKLAAEATARAAAELSNAQSAKASAEKANQVQKQTNWQWFLVIAGPVVAYLVGWVGAGGLAQ